MAKIKELATEQRPNIVWLLLSWIGGGMLSTSILTSLLHWLQSIPLNLQLILSLFILSLILLAAAYFFARRQPRGQIVTTSAQRDEQATPAIDKWLHEIAEAQSKSIGSYVRVSCALGGFDLLRDSSLYIDFGFLITSSCVYKLSLKQIDGYIHLAGTPFRDPPTVARNELKNVSIGREGWLTVRQKLTTAEAAAVLNSHTWFGFDQMNLARSKLRGIKIARVERSHPTCLAL